MPKISIIIPVYNVEKYLSRCLDSVVNQSIEDIEIICIDDKSTDTSLAILNKYKNDDDRIELIISQQNEGLSATRNKGIYKAKGKYIYFLDSDDWLEKNALETLYNEATLYNLDIVGFDSYCVYENDEVKKHCQPYKAARTGNYNNIYTGIEVFCLFSQYDDHSSVVWRYFWSRRFILENKLIFFETILHEDLLFYFEAFLLAKRVKIIPYKYYYYYRNIDSITLKPASYKTLESSIIIYTQIKLFLAKCFVPQDYKVWIFDYVKIVYAFAKSTFNYLWKYNDREIEKVLFTDFIYDVELNILKQSFEGEICKKIDALKIAEIKNFKRIIIYGAGWVGKDVMKHLLSNDIQEFYFAVSQNFQHKLYVGGNFVYCINDFLDEKKDCVVLVAVSSKYQKEVFENLKKLEFENIIFI